MRPKQNSHQATCRPSANLAASTSDSPRKKQEGLRRVAWISRHSPRRRREFPQASRHLPWHRREFPQVSRHLPRHRREFPPVSRNLPRHRRRLRRSHGICRDIGAGCAALKAFAATSAQVAPLPKHLPRHRRRLRRSQSICRDVGAGCAALKAFAAATVEKSADRLLTSNSRRLEDAGCHRFSRRVKALRRKEGGTPATGADTRRNGRN